MKYEFSAGGIVYKRRTMRNLTQNNAEDILALVCQHSQHHGWVFPKGLIGDHVKGEKKEDTAIREVEEETGIVGKIIQPLEPIAYWYVFTGEKIKKTVYYFLMKYKSGDTKNHDFEMENVEWLPIKKVEERLTYKSDKIAWKQARSLISNKYHFQISNKIGY